MARFGGLPGGGGGMDMMRLMKQAQKMQEDAAKLQQDMQAARFEGKAGGEMVRVVVNGHGHLVSVHIEPSLCSPDDVELLEDLIITAAKEASSTAQAEQEKGMEKITGTLEGLNLPPGLF